MFVIGLPILRDVEFGIFVFEHLSVGAMSGGWLDFWTWTLGLANAVVTGAAYWWLERKALLSVPTRMLVAWFCGTLATIGGGLLALALALIVWFVIGMILMLFAGPF